MAFNWPADDLTIKERVGVGTDTPSERLDVKGSIKLDKGVAINEFSIDGAFATSGNQSVPTTEAAKTYIDTQVTTINTALTTKADKGGSLAQDFQVNNLTVQGNLEVTGTTTFRNIEQHQGDLELGNEDTDQVRIHGVVRSTHSSNTLQIGSPLKVTGTVTADKFVGDGSGLTGLAGATQWSNGASGRISYSGGNVGIGTTSPTNNLHVVGSGPVTIENPNGESDILFKSGNNQSWQVGTNTQGWYVWDNAYRLVVKPGGNIGVGTTSPAFKLDVAGAAHASSFPTSSDVRLKTRVTQLVGVLDKLDQIRGISFEWNEVYESLGRSTGQREIGVAAQEVEAVFPELVSTWGEAGYKAVDYGRLTGVLIEAVKELKAENRALNDRINFLEITMSNYQRG